MKNPIQNDRRKSINPKLSSREKISCKHFAKRIRINLLPPTVSFSNLLSVLNLAAKHCIIALIVLKLY
jgi:hypothetical protein